MVYREKRRVCIDMKSSLVAVRDTERETQREEAGWGRPFSLSLFPWEQESLDFRQSRPLLGTSTTVVSHSAMCYVHGMYICMYPQSGVCPVKSLTVCIKLLLIMTHETWQKQKLQLTYY